MEVAELLQKILLNSVPKGAKISENALNVSCDISGGKHCFLHYRIGTVQYRLTLDKHEFGLVGEEEEEVSPEGE